MSTTETPDAPLENTNTSLMRMILSLHGTQQQAFIAALTECSDQLRANSERLMAIIDDPKSLPGDKGRAWHTLLDQFRLLPDTEGRYGMDLAQSEAGAAEKFPALQAEVEKMDSQEALFAERLRQLMKTKHITQKQLAERVECTQPAISQMLNRKCRPQRATLEKIAVALQVDVRELWPDIEVVDYLDSVVDFGRDGQVMSEEMANALRDDLQAQSPIRGERLPSWKEAKQNGE
ncbi:helix-turn-helix domain-containing protein [Rhodopirellula baltica]